MGGTPGFAQTAADELDEVEAQLEKAEAAAAAKLAQQKAATAEAARVARQNADAQRLKGLEVQRLKDAESARAAEASRKASAQALGTLVLQSDADCALSIDGGPQGKLSVGQPKSLEVKPGEQLIRCVSSVDARAVVEVVKTVTAGSKQVIKLRLADEIKPKIDTRTAGTVFNDRLKDGSTGPSMVVIPAGRFTMGSPDSEADRATDEGPQHAVTLKAFAMAKTEVTVAQYRQFVNATGYRTDAENNTDVPTVAGSESGCFSFDGTKFGYVAGTSWRSPGFDQGDQNPAVCLSSNDAQAYVTWLAEETGKPYRLPSEAQQEYVIRAGSDTRFAWGNDVDSVCTHANVLDQSAAQKLTGGVNCTDGYLFTGMVGHYSVNAFGLHDTVGNALEWAADCWNESYAGAPNDGTSWNSGDCGRRVLRGAGWSFRPATLRAANRNWSARADRYIYTGLRPIQDL